MDKDLFKRFEAYLLRRGNKPLTIYKRISSIKKLLREVSPLTPENLELYFANMAKTRKGTTVNTLIDTMRVFADFLGRYELRIKHFPQEDPIKTTMSDEEIERFLALPPPSRTSENRKIEYYRWTKFFKICAMTGARPGEIANLTVDGVDFGLNALIVDGKMGKRKIPMAENIKDDLKNLIDNEKDGFLFWSSKGGNGGDAKQQNPVFTATQRHYYFHGRLKRLGIKRRGLTPHSLRHSFITQLLEEDVNLFKVQKIVGHKRIETTAQYTHMTLKDVQQAIKKHPIIRKQTDPYSILQAIKELIQSFELEKDQRFEYVITETTDELSLSVKVVNKPSS